MKVALIGTRGVPARYGGFETAVEEVGRRLVERGHDVIVFCRVTPGQEAPASHLGMTLVQLPAVRQRSLETLSHTAASVVHRCLHGVDAAVVFNAANAPLLPVLRARRIPLATHVDGLEWQRAKWGTVGRRYYRLAESWAVRLSDALIADAQGIADYYETEFGAPTRLIAYGAPILTDVATDRLAEFDVAPAGYHLVVARLEPENHVLEIVQGYVSSRARLPLVVVGTAPYGTEYIAAIEAAADHRVKLVGGLWDQAQLDQLYAHSLSYLHGHSVGGTNPSLLRAAGAGAFVIAFDGPFNREVAGEHAEYFTGPADAGRLIERAEADPASAAARGAALQRAISRYDWGEVADSYEHLLAELADPNVAFPPRPSGRRLRPARMAGVRRPTPAFVLPLRSGKGVAR